MAASETCEISSGETIVHGCMCAWTGRVDIARFRRVASMMASPRYTTMGPQLLQLRCPAARASKPPWSHIPFLPTLHGNKDMRKTPYMYRARAPNRAAI